MAAATEADMATAAVTAAPTTAPHTAATATTGIARAIARLSTATAATIADSVAIADTTVALVATVATTGVIADTTVASVAVDSAATMVAIITKRCFWTGASHRLCSFSSHRPAFFCGVNELSRHARSAVDQSIKIRQTDRGDDATGKSRTLNEQRLRPLHPLRAAASAAAIPAQPPHQTRTSV
jgi:hypothetical protein